MVEVEAVDEVQDAVLGELPEEEKQVEEGAEHSLMVKSQDHKKIFR